MALSDFKPTIWSAALQGHLDKALVAGSVVSTQYEGELTYGNSIVINKVGAVTGANYDPDAYMASGCPDGFCPMPGVRQGPSEGMFSPICDN